jgi:hypothetical protein
MNTLSIEQIDALLTLQLAVAWAGETGLDNPRLGWWSTQLDEEFGGLDLFSRLLPRTQLWAALDAARQAARRTEDALRTDAIAADTRIATLFRLGFDVDEQLDDRLRDLTRSQRRPLIALPELTALLGPDNPDEPFGRRAFDPAAFREWCAGCGEAKYRTSPLGRRVAHADAPVLVPRLVAALATPNAQWPMPHAVVPVS